MDEPASGGEGDTVGQVTNHPNGMGRDQMGPDELAHDEQGLSEQATAILGHDDPVHDNTGDCQELSELDAAAKEKEAKRADLLHPDSLQRLLADALTYKSPMKDLQTILRCGGSVDGPVKRGLRPLHYAVHSENLDGIRFLLDNGADVNAPDNIGYRPVHLCARKGLLEPLTLLIEHGARVDFFADASSLGYLTIEPLNMAIENGHVECVRLLLTHGARPDHLYFLGHEINLVPLDNLDCLALLLEFGANPNVFSRCGLTPLMKACKEHNIRASRILMDHGADLDLQPPARFEQKTAIHFAIQAGSNGITNALLRRGAMVARPPGYKYSALHTAVNYDSPALCDLLLRWEAQVDERTDDHSTSLQLACATIGLHNRLEIVQVLLRHGADPNTSSPFISYSSPFLAPLTEYLRCVTDQAEYEVVRMLIVYGAKVHFRPASTSRRARDHHGILHCVQYLKDKPDVFNLLVSVATRFEVDAIRSYSSLDQAQRESLLAVSVSPRDLRTLCHLVLRDFLCPDLLGRVPLLPVPGIVKDFLVFQRPPVCL